jgi:recombination protein RecA
MMFYERLKRSTVKGTIINFEDDRFDDVECIPSGSLSLDMALGGGYAVGRIIEIFGEESSGKTTLAIHAAVNFQKRFPDKAVLYIDVENAFDTFYGESLGLSYKKNQWLFSQPRSGEEAFDIIDDMIKSGEISLIVVDSVAALIPRAELEGEYGESKIGLQARLMSQAMRKLVNIISKYKCTVIFINQMRDKIGVMFGDTKTTTGGHALKFYSSQRLEVSRAGQEKDGDEVTANKTRVKVKKNKIAPPFRKAEFNIVFGEGIDTVGEIINLASESGIIKKSGSWYSYDEVKLGQGTDSAKKLLKDNPELFEQIENKLRKYLGLIS